MKLSDMMADLFPLSERQLAEKEKIISPGNQM
jgi:hypothetical protein